jgi:hypothetical protein
MPRRLGSSLLAIGIATISGFAALVGLVWGFGLKCDDSCGEAPPWRDDPSAWQWNALGAVAIGGFVCSLLLVAAVVSRRRALASAALVSWGFLAVAFLTLFRGSGLTSHAERGWLGFVGVAIAGLTTIALMPPRNRLSPGL